jgi:hypothetical protein
MADTWGTTKDYSNYTGGSDLGGYTGSGNFSSPSSPATTPATDRAAFMAAERETYQQQTDAANAAAAAAAANNTARIAAEREAYTQQQAELDRALAQGRGSNVTSDRPFSPVDTIRYGMGPAVQQQAVGPLSLPTFAQYSVSPYTVGMPSIMATMPQPPMTITLPTDTFKPIGYGIPDLGTPSTPYDFTGGTTGPTRRGVPESAVRLNFDYENRDVLNKFLDQTATTESSGDPTAKNPQSSATGLYQFTKDTWMKTIQQNRPDLLVGRTQQEVLDLRNNPILSTEMARDLAISNARDLEANNIPITPGTLYTAHFLGSGAAIDALLSDPNTPISDIVSQQVIDKNQKVLGGGKTTSDVLDWANAQMNKPLVSAKDPMLEAGSANGTKVAMLGDAGDVLAATAQAEQGLVGPDIGGRKEAAQAASSSPQTFGDWLSGLFDSSARIQELEGQGRTLTDKDWYRQDMEQQLGRPVDISEVKSRIVDYGSGPQVDYYLKDIGTALYDAVTGSPDSTGIRSLNDGSSPRRNDTVETGGGGSAEESATPSTEVPPDEASTTPEILTTGIDLTRRVYTGNPLVRGRGLLG